MHDTGLIWQFIGVQCSQYNSCPSWRLIDNNSASSQIVSGAGYLYQMWYIGAIWRYTETPCNGGNCPGWQLLDNNPATTQIIAAGSNLYQRHKGGAVWKYTGTRCSGNSCPG
jgi:peptidyl-Asp metalloendopeptidase